MMNTGNGCRKIEGADLLATGQDCIYPFQGRIRSLLQLCKLPICLMVAFSAFFGSVLAGPAGPSSTLMITLGMMLLAGGGAALNSWQEVRLDSSMSRTRNRPLPRGLVPAGQAAILAILLITAGLIMLYLGSRKPLAAGLGFAAVILYNVFYTPLKTRTVAALIPGAVSGALPPYIGWTAAGGDPLSSFALLMVVCFILWQIPHSLLLTLTYRDDYLESDIPSPIKLFSEASLKRLLLVWVGAFLAVLLCWTELLMGLAGWARFLIPMSICIVFILFCVQLPGRRKSGYHSIFIQFNCYLFFVMAILAGDRLFFC
ncbi:MAG: protoheme IX farnesyltransferase [Desulfocapsaceae bacterium]|nr:protoheme IX farnesyltransferase [Desulfocapsaceae bacterium]